MGSGKGKVLLATPPLWGWGGKQEGRFAGQKSLCFATQKGKAIKPGAAAFVKKTQSYENFDFEIRALQNTAVEYKLEPFSRSNQDTCLVQKPAVFEGQWVQAGDLLADCASSVGGELALGQNILIAYMPWEGYNYEDAILVSERLVFDDLYTSIHIERYDIDKRETKLGLEQITREIPDISISELSSLDKYGVVKIGSWVEEGDILVGKVTPVNKNVQSPYQKLLYTILEKEYNPIRDSSLRAPRGIKAKVIDVKIFFNGSRSAPPPQRGVKRGGVARSAPASLLLPIPKGGRDEKASEKGTSEQGRGEA